MVPPVQKDPLRVQPLVRKQRQGDLDGPRTSVDKVPVEDDGVVFGWRGEDGQEVAEVVELLQTVRAVYVQQTRTRSRCSLTAGSSCE